MGYRMKDPRNTAGLNYPANSDPYGGRLPSWNVIAQHITSAKAKEAALRLDTHGIFHIIRLTTPYDKNSIDEEEANKMKKFGDDRTLKLPVLRRS